MAVAAVAAAGQASAVAPSPVAADDGADASEERTSESELDGDVDAGGLDADTLPGGGSSRSFVLHVAPHVASQGLCR